MFLCRVRRLMASCVEYRADFEALLHDGVAGWCGGLL